MPDDLLAQQRAREERAQERAHWRAGAAQRKAIEQGYQSRTAYGMRLFSSCCARLAGELDDRLSAYEINPTASRYLGSAYHLIRRVGGPKQITATALPVVLDRITQPIGFDQLALKVGRALEREALAVDLRERVGEVWFDEFSRRYRLRQRGGDKQLQKLIERHGLATRRWTRGEQFKVGALVLDCIKARCDLLAEQQTPGGPVFRPSSTARQLIASCGPRAMPPAHSPMLCPPVRWEGLVGGGLLLEEDQLVRPSKGNRGLGVPHLEGLELGRVLAGVNALQGVQLRVRPAMAELQYATFQASNRRIWSVGASPVVLPSRPAAGGEEAAKSWRIQFAKAKEREQRERTQRTRVVQQLAAAMELRGRPIWQAYFLDHRGRAYPRNKLLSHQGPDHQKALLEFGQGEVIGEREARWLLVAAASHHGCGRLPWSERLAYGLELREQMRVVAEDPQGRTELWAGAADPWQFLQVALAWAAWETDPSEPVHCPIRFDQTTSGPGILAALLRDRQMAVACNMAGSKPGDLYLVVLGQVQAELQRLAFQAEHQWQQDAAAMLAPLVGRDQMKQAVMAGPYGATLRTIRQELADWLLEVRGSRASYREEVLAPAVLLSGLIYAKAKAVTQTALDFRAWFNRLGRAVIEKGRPVQWTSPSGLLVSCGERPARGTQVHTAISGKWCVSTVYEADPDAPLAMNDTRRGLTANLIHSFDAALVHLMAPLAEARGVPLLCNHDCFATLPSRAEWLHGALLEENRRIYSRNWLVEVVEEVAHRGEVELPRRLPIVGTLDPAEIGTNPYLYG